MGSLGVGDGEAIQARMSLGGGGGGGWDAGREALRLRGIGGGGGGRSCDFKALCFLRRAQRKKLKKPASSRAPAAEPAPIPAIPGVESPEAAGAEDGM